MKSTLLTIASAVVFSTSAFAGNAPESEREAIRSFAGCYEVTFDFAETFALQDGYKIKAPYFSSGREWITVDEDSGDRLSLQHVLIPPGGAGVIKHWRQEWIYEGTSLLSFRGNATWERTSIAPSQARGRWVQRVFQVDDSPRYECSAPWVQWGSTRYWECEAWAPLPRREFSKRSDYNVLSRRNRQSLMADGWLHEEDNVKLAVPTNSVSGPIKAIAKEKGENRYRQIDDSKCEAAREWWEENRGAWHGINDAWNAILAREAKIAFVTPQGQPPLFEKLFELGDKAVQSQLSRQEVAREAAAIIALYLVPATSSF